MTEHDAGPVETIVRIGADGGLIALQGRRDAGGHWQFRLGTNEAALHDMLDEKPQPTDPVLWVSSWNEALALMGRYPWPRLHSVAVHPEFKDAVFAAIAAHEEGGQRQVERWGAALDD